MTDLNELLKGIDVKTRSSWPGLEISGISCDSRKVKVGGLFVAVNGCSTDGYKFIRDAISNGAKIVLTEKDFKAPQGIKKILVRDARKALPILADNFYRHPSKTLKVIGVTGTNGKTTITYIIEGILKHAGESPGVIGTINYRFKDNILPAKNTTPGPIELQSMLADMLKGDSRYVIMEASSHSLDQGRVDNIWFDTAIFTNVTSEHLDYHKTVECYFKAKAKIFDKIKDGGAAILNSDDERAREFRKTIKKRTVTYGIENKADVMAERIKLSLDRSRFLAITPNGAIEIETKLIGRHNVSNILAAVAASFAGGINPEAIKRGVESCAQVPGRLERIEEGQPFNVFVDYAHTEDALYNILRFLRELAKRKVITVFGCGGNRDRKKRPLMGKVACIYSDKVVITLDNPRFEDPRRIMNDIEKGIVGRFSNYDMVEDRYDAIAKALGLASKDDIVVIAGKGHEKYQMIKDEEIPFDDCDVARRMLIEGRAG